MKVLTLIALVLTLGACGADESAETARDSGATAAGSERAPTVGKEIADSLNNSMDKAKNVENQALQQKPAVEPVIRSEDKVGRNDPCICGSGKKYKNCCGKSS